LTVSNEEELSEIALLIERFVKSKNERLGSSPVRSEGTGPSLFASLRETLIDGPEDFSRNLDLYLRGEKRIDGKVQ
jgi:hypothetical protein